MTDWIDHGGGTYFGFVGVFDSAEQADRLLPLLFEPLGAIKLTAALHREKGLETHDMVIRVDGEPEREMTFAEFEERYG